MYLLYSVNVYIFNVVIEIKFYSILFYLRIVLVTRIHYANELLNMAAERCKYATYLPRCSEKTPGSNVFKIGGNNAQRLCLLHEIHFKRMYAKKIMQHLKIQTKWSN